ncbi:hypothetical protein [Enterovibrio norvegicus]|uniref:hypothetical protein n=1 Tax=Enterovibrio norvegicus TaxID=188144 RepID=UPI00355323B9
MSKLLHPLNVALKDLEDFFDSTSMPEGHLSEVWGWHYPYCTMDDLSNIISNFRTRLEIYSDVEPDIDESLLIRHVTSLNHMLRHCKTYAGNNNNFQTMGSSLFGSLFIILSDLEFELFSWEKISDKGLVPKNISRRCISIKDQVDALEKDSENLSGKVDEINKAHAAAESLPTDLALLKKTRKEIQEEQNEAKTRVDHFLKNTQQASADAQVALNETNSYKAEIELTLEKLKASQKKAEIIISECDDALQIATTEGLAAGFDQKAKELRNSIWVYIGGLVLALISGAVLGALRVNAFTEVLNQSLTAGQAVLHTIMAIFSIGGPLWLAWICTQQINHRFRLSEDYSYKATVAKSFMGFSKLAERFDRETEARLFNSTLDRLDEMPLRLIESRDYNSPWHEFVDSDAFKKAIDIVPQLAKEAGRFASNTKLKKGPKKKIEEVSSVKTVVSDEAKSDAA